MNTLSASKRSCRFVGAGVRLVREERGAALAFTIAVFLFLFVLCLSVYSVGETIRRKTELQNACDAAAYSAAVVQADALSRMAVVNRAMSWSYIQMTKAELDYYTFLWLERVKERFENDSKKCLKIQKDSLPTKFDESCGWWHSKHSFLHPVLPGQGIVPPIIDFYGNMYTFGLNCHERVHDNPGDNTTYSKARWIGLGHDAPNRIRIGYETGGQLEYRNGDLCLPSDSDPVPLVQTFSQQFGEHGRELQKAIAEYQTDILSCNLLLGDICEKMTNAIPETVRRTLLENLPRTASGELDESVWDQYRYACVGGVSAPPPDYGAEDVETGDASGNEDVTRGSYFSGLRNVEEDELRFLDMADGLPETRTGPGGTVTLKDWFAGTGDELSRIRDLAGGLDQWFIRCRPSETAVSDQISLDRQPQFAIPGIVRSYKNANYDEGRSTGSILGSIAGKFNCDIHRGNHVLPSVPTVKIPSFSSLFNNRGNNPASSVPRGPGGYFGQRIRRFQRRIRKRVESAWNRIQNEIIKIVTAPVQGLIDVVNETIRDFCNLDVDPSCKNEVDAFVDQCSNVGETTGLVAEYEWATAYWICGWAKKNGKLISCFHVPVPVGLAFGSEADSYGKGLFKWVKPELKMFNERTDGSGKRSKGFSRAEYHDTFIGLNTDATDNCSRGVLNGRGANTILKAYARIYGDDRELMPYFIQDKIPAKPWVLNEKFFEGAGTIVVALAKEQRNVFDWLADAVSDDKGIHSAFSPAGADGKTPYYVALAAGRAGPARRTGTGRADGADTENANVLVPKYDVAWNTVTDRTLGPVPSGGTAGHPQLAKGDEELRSYLLKEFRRNGFGLVELERDHRWGCACGEENTDRRLAREWNLSQADWDGMLLPLRHAFSATAAPHDTGAATPEQPVWDWNETVGYGENGPTGVDLLFSTLRGLEWRRFDRAGAADESTDDILGDSSNLSLFRLRRLL